MHTDTERWVLEELHIQTIGLQGIQNFANKGLQPLAKFHKKGSIRPEERKEAIVHRRGRKHSFIGEEGSIRP